MKQKKINWVLQEFLSKGRVTRNEALKKGVTRLASIVHILRKEGLDISGKYLKTNTGNDYVYELQEHGQTRIPDAKQPKRNSVEIFRTEKS